MGMHDGKYPFRVFALSILPILAPGLLEAQRDRQPPPAEPAASSNGSADSDRFRSLDDLRGLRLIPSQVRLWGKGASQSFLVVATDARGLEVDITSDCRFRPVG